MGPLLAVAVLCIALPARGAGPAPSPQPATAAEVLAAVRAADAEAVLVNVWATWCIPCREEFPDLMRLRRAYADQGLKVLFVSGDFSTERAAAAAFLTEQGVDFPTYIKTGDDMQFINAVDPQWSGALPATFIYDRSGTRRHALLGKSSYAQFEEKVRDVLKK
ncbi:MAG: TlpA disulfide reductase family protein [Candidatus Binatia bacterium]